MPVGSVVQCSAVRAASRVRREPGYNVRVTDGSRQTARGYISILFFRPSLNVSTSELLFVSVLNVEEMAYSVDLETLHYI